MVPFLSIVVLLALAAEPSAHAAPLPARDARARSFCASLATADAREQCHRETGKKPGKQYDGAALSACASFPTDRDRLRCLVISREARSFEPEALALCLDLSSTADRLACLGTIAGAWYRTASLRQCRSAGDGPRAIRCLVDNRE